LKIFSLNILQDGEQKIRKKEGNLIKIYDLKDGKIANDKLIFNSLFLLIFSHSFEEEIVSKNIQTSKTMTY